MSELTGADLLGKAIVPQGHPDRLRMARMARAYHAMAPYPRWGFSEWKTEDRGPLPRCLPHCRRIVEEQARSLFGKPVTFKADTPEQGEWLNDVWNFNNMGGRSVAMAGLGGLAGSVVLKWSVDEQRSKTPVRIDVLDAAEQAQCFFDPHDPEKLLMMRVCYPYFDYADQKWKLYTEDWTDETHVTYVPRVIENATTLDQAYVGAPQAMSRDLVPQSTKANPFGIVPAWQISNTEGEGPYGMGDCWPLFQLVDMLNFIFDLRYKDNQNRVMPGKVYIDAKQEDSEPPTMMSGSEESLKSDDGKQAKVEILETNPAFREYLAADYEEAQHLVADAAGGVFLRPDDITGKGAMSALVLDLMFRPLDAKVEEKRKLYGEDGVCVFFERLTKGLANSSFKALGPGVVEDCAVLWPSMRPLPPEEKRVEVDRQAAMVAAGFTTRKRAVMALAAMDDVADPDELAEETEELDPVTVPGGANDPEKAPNDRKQGRDGGDTD